MSNLSIREKVLIIFCAILLSINIYQFYSDKAQKNSGEVYDLDYIQSQQKDQINSGDTKDKESSGSDDVNKSCVVYVCGNVKNPGVYELKLGDRINDAINLAGGALPKSDLNLINLAEKVADGQKIYVPKVGESIDLSLTENKTSSSMSAYGRDNTNGKININTASKEQLKTLYKIGDKLAQRIIEYRQKNGGFKNIEELKNVSGIGEKIYEAIKDSIVAQ